MDVYVVMANDFPDSVYDDRLAALKYVEEKSQAERRAKQRDHLHRTIHWRFHNFTLRSGADG